MRTIKFRQPIVQDGVFKRFYYWGFDVMPNGRGGFDKAFSSPIGKDQTEVDGRDSDQFTGLKDKNRKEIYEGDIVKDGKETEEVQYFDGYFSPFAVSPGHGYVEKGEPWRYVEDCEVIGNIYEHKHLLDSTDMKA